MYNKDARLKKVKKSATGKKIEKQRSKNVEIAYFDGSPSCLIPKIYHSPFQLVPTLAHENCLSPLYLQGAHNVIPHPNIRGGGHYENLDV